MNFNSIKKYWNFDGYNRIKIIKSKQKTNQKSSKTNAKTYDDYLDKISGFQCCCKEEVCNCCCTYSLNGCCKKETTQTFTTGAECICFTGMMEVRSGPGPYENPGVATGTGYNDISGQVNSSPPSAPLRPFGSLYPKKTCEELVIESITYVGGQTPTHKPNIQVTFSGDTWGGIFFKCILLRNGKKVIKLYRDNIYINSNPPFTNPHVWSTTEPQGGPFTTYFWNIPESLAIIEGKWCVQISM